MPFKPLENDMNVLGTDLKVTKFKHEAIDVDLEANEVNRETIVSCLTERTPRLARKPLFDHEFADDHLEVDHEVVGNESKDTAV